MSSLAVFGAAIRVKSTHRIDKIMFENQKKRENMDREEIFL